jgi:hypothetical protein
MAVISRTRSPQLSGLDLTLGSISWANRDNIKLEDGVFSTAVPDGPYGGWTYYLTASNFGFSIPTYDIVKGIKVEIKRKASGGILGDYSVKLIKGGVIGGTEHGLAANWPTVNEYATYGSSTDMWGLAWDPADINAITFGVGISVGFPWDGDGIAYIDYIKMTVYSRASIKSQLILISDDV